MFSAKRLFTPVVLAAAAFVAGCEGETNNEKTTVDDKLVVPQRYEFDSRFGEGSSVSYGGQALRQVLIADLAKHIGNLNDDLADPAFVPDQEALLAGFNFYYDYDGSEADIMLSTDPATAQKIYPDIGNANLKGKIAGNDEGGQHKDWSTQFVGWDEEGVTTPDSLVQHWFARLATMAVEHYNTPASGPGGVEISKYFVTPKGQDLQQLVQKFLLGAVTYSQGADDYLDDASLEESGNVEAEEGKPYTKLEHHWDEGFGYFGAARDYGDYTDDEIAAADGRDDYQGYHDTNGDGAIDLTSEYNFGHSQNAAKRDRGSAESAKTDFTKGAWDAFLTGRAIIASAKGALSATQMADLKAQRDAAIANWELAIAASALHYVNEVLADMSKSEADYVFLDHAKHWSELKGFALSLQFNPRKKLSDAQFATLHEKLGIAPALPGDANFDDYKAGLIDARQILADAYGVAAANIGDDNGAGGW